MELFGQHGKEIQKSRKRKVDKDGFLCPSTPDIHITSSQPEEAVPVEDSLTNEQSYDIDTVSSYFYQDKQSSENQFTELMGHTPSNGAGDGTQGEDSRTGNINTLFRKFEQEFALTSDQWCKVLRQGEEFETLSTQKLDVLIKEAKNLDKTLGTQKDVLCERLMSIGKTLQM